MVILRSSGNLEVVIHSKNEWDPINIGDRQGFEEFILIADKLLHNDLRKLTSINPYFTPYLIPYLTSYKNSCDVISAEIYFFEGRQQRHSCFRKQGSFQHGERSTKNDVNDSPDIVSVDETDDSADENADTDFDQAIKSTMNSRIRNGSDVSFVAIRNGKVRLRP